MKKRNILLTSLLIILTASFVVLPQGVLAANKCGGADTSIISCSGQGKDAILDLLKIVIQIMTAGVGVSAVGATIFGAILYTSSADSPDKIKQAKTIWTNTVIGLLLFAFMVAITNFLIPGGVF